MGQLSDVEANVRRLGAAIKAAHEADRGVSDTDRAAYLKAEAELWEAGLTLVSSVLLDLRRIANAIEDIERHGVGVKQPSNGGAGGTLRPFG